MTITEPTDGLTAPSPAALAASSNEELIEYILTRFHDVHRDQLPDLITLARILFNRIDGRMGGAQHG